MEYGKADMAESFLLMVMFRSAQLHPQDDSDTGRLIAAIKGYPFERLYLVALFTRMRRGEVLGLVWDSVDFARETILINQQLQKHQERDGSYGYHLVPTKNSRGDHHLGPL